MIASYWRQYALALGVARDVARGQDFEIGAEFHMVPDGLACRIGRLAVPISSGGVANVTAELERGPRRFALELRREPDTGFAFSWRLEPTAELDYPIELKDGDWIKLRGFWAAEAAGVVRGVAMCSIAFVDEETALAPVRPVRKGGRR